MKNPKVEDYLIQKAHPFTEEIKLVRDIVLGADERIDETIKWNRQSFIYKGYLASFFVNAKKIVRLMFHKGALLPNKNCLLTGDGKQGGVVKFDNMEDIEKKKDALVSVVLEWIDIQDYLF